MLSAEDQVCDGFFDVNGEFPELGAGDVFPSYDFLSRFEPAMDDLREVVLIDREKDTALASVENLATQAFCGLVPGGMMTGVSAVAQVVSSHMGGPAADDNEIYGRWQAVSAALKMARSPSGVGGLIVPLGAIHPGLSRHRALLFKYLADQLCFPCQLLRARSNNFFDDLVAMVIVYMDGQEFLVDLMQNPGVIVTPQEFYNRIASSNATMGRGVLPAAASPPPPAVPGQLPPERNTSGREVVPAVEEDALSNASSEADGPAEWSNAQIARSISGSRRRLEPAPQAAPQLSSTDLLHRRKESHDLIDLRSPSVGRPAAMPSPFGAASASRQPTVRPLSPMRNRSPTGGAHSDAGLPPPMTSEPSAGPSHAVEHAESGHLDLPVDSFQQRDSDSSSSTDDASDEEYQESTPGFRVWDPITDCLIDMSEVNIMSRLGMGSYGEVHRAEWQGTEVAVKQFLEQQMTDAVQEEFLQEVRIMKDLRHPNIVQFMGATWKPRGIVMQYMHRGSLFRLLHRSSKSKRLHMHRRLRMALDVALGMRYLHSRKPLIVHRDLKSPNLLVARDWTVRLCDFGLSKLKSNTFLSTKSTGGTPEWMAPEVLRNEPANEKSDIYSFAVIMWELMFYMEPWQGTRPMQVVFAVGSNNKRLPLPHNSPLNSLIEDCWQADPEARPSFDEIYERLKKLQRPINNNFEEGPPSPGVTMPDLSLTASTSDAALSET